MMKLGGRCIVQKSPLEFEFGCHSPLGAYPQKGSVGLRHWENRRRLSSLLLIVTRVIIVVHIGVVFVNYNTV